MFVKGWFVVCHWDGFPKFMSRMTLITYKPMWEAVSTSGKTLKFCIWITFKLKKIWDMMIKANIQVFNLQAKLVKSSHVLLDMCMCRLPWQHLRLKIFLVKFICLPSPSLPPKLHSLCLLSPFPQSWHLSVSKVLSLFKPKTQGVCFGCLYSQWVELQTLHHHLLTAAAIQLFHLHLLSPGSRETSAQILALGSAFQPLITITALPLQGNNSINPYSSAHFIS